VVESGSHDELIDMNNGQGGAYSKMVQVQQSTVEKEAFTSSYLQTEDTYYRRSSCMRTPQTPINVRSSMSSPAYPFSSTFSMNLTHSFQMHPFNDHFNSNKKNKDHPPASQWRLLRMNAPEWKQAFWSTYINLQPEKHKVRTLLA
jgi:ATP-binding cassette subfamily B (MDR/TAP) protein 1